VKIDGNDEDEPATTMPAAASLMLGSFAVVHLRALSFRLALDHALNGIRAHFFVDALFPNLGRASIKNAARSEGIFFTP
jgi:hypothetical protein